MLGPSIARMALSWMARQRMARSVTTSTTPESRTRLAQGNLCRDVRAKRSQLLSSSPESGRHLSQIFGSFASSSAGSSTKMGEELSQNPTVRASPRWMLTPLARARVKDASSVGVPATRPKIAGSTKAKAKARAKGKERARLTRTVAPSSRVSAATGKKGHKIGRPPEATGGGEREESPRRRD